MPGVLPTKTGVAIKHTDETSTTLPAATPTAAGCMTAEHVRMLETLWLVHQTHGSGSVTILPPAPAVDTTNLVTKGQLATLLQALPRPPDVRQIMSEIDTMRQQMALPAPAEDHQVRQVVSAALEEVGKLESRVRRVEAVIEMLKQVAAIKAQMEEAA